MEHNATKSALPADLHGQTLALEGDICALAQKLGIKLTQDKALEDKLGTSIDDALPPKLDELMALLAMSLMPPILRIKLPYKVRKGKLCPQAFGVPANLRHAAPSRALPLSLTYRAMSSICICAIWKRIATNSRKKIKASYSPKRKRSKALSSSFFFLGVGVACAAGCGVGICPGIYSCTCGPAG